MPRGGYDTTLVVKPFGPERPPATDKPQSPEKPKDTEKPQSPKKPQEKK